MKRILNHILVHRAERLAARLAPFIGHGGRWLDIGCGTGHNAAALAARCRCAFDQADVVDLHVVGPPPVLFNGHALPFASSSFDGALMLFVLQYVADPAPLLREARRVVRGRLLVIQSTWQSHAGLATLRGREWLQGRFALRMARRLGLVAAPDENALRPRHYLTRRRLGELFTAAGWYAAHCQSAPWPLVGLSRDLYVLE